MDKVDNNKYQFRLENRLVENAYNHVTVVPHMHYHFEEDYLESADERIIASKNIVVPSSSEAQTSTQIKHSFYL